MRFRSLDGLRGIAALVVLAHHSLLLVPGFSAAYLGNVPPARGTLFWWLNYSPLKILTAGGEAVIVFFVLSGLVLALPITKGPAFDWLAYYPQRVVRLLLPVLGSVLLAGILVFLVPQIPFQAPGTWLDVSSTRQPTIFQILAAANLFGDSTNFQINNPLWSLRWELLFSLALPIFFVVAVAVRRWWIPVIGVVVLLTVCGRWTASLEPLAFFPSFFVGTLIAVKLDDLRALNERINSSRLRHVFWSLFVLFAFLLLIGSWLVAPLVGSGTYVTLVLQSLVPIAAGMIVIACIGWGVLERLLQFPVVQVAGNVSFSLYLTHVPVLIFTSYLLRGAPLKLVLPVADCLELTEAFGFFYLVESRSHRLSKRVGAWVRFTKRDRDVTSAQIE
jgi:peptidoglycan/LPS O-acetylase OafA/YrhL